MSKKQSATLIIMGVLVIVVFCGLGFVVFTTMRGTDQQVPTSQIMPTTTPIPTAQHTPTWTPTLSPTWTPEPTYTPTSTETPIPFDASNLEKSYCQIVQAAVARYEIVDLYCEIQETLPTGRVLLDVDITFPDDRIGYLELLELQVLLQKAFFTAPVAPGAVDVFTRVGDLGPQQCVYKSGIGYKTQETFDWDAVRDASDYAELWDQLRNMDNKQDLTGQDQEWLGYAGNYPPNCP